ncbi:MAG: NAD(P)-dependent oxidoreductase [Acidimicrobiia bacterium]
MTRRVLVTGGGGFVGAPAVTELGQRGFEVHVAARHQGANPTAREWHVLDLLDGASLDALIKSVAPTHLLHLAWCTEHGAFWDDPANDAWVEATARLAGAFREAGGQRIVVAGSCAQYGWDGDSLGPDGFASERDTPRRPATRYGVAKETVARGLDRSAAMGLVFFPYGPNEQPGRLVPTVTRSLLEGTPAPISSGMQVRDFLHVADCGAAFAALLDSDVTGPVNVGSGTGTSVLEVVQAIARSLDREDLLRVGALPDRPADPPRLVADVTRLHEEVGFEPRFTLESGLTAAVDWWRQRIRRR